MGMSATTTDNSYALYNGQVSFGEEWIGPTYSKVLHMHVPEQGEL
jgi:hypothetical protein